VTLAVSGELPTARAMSQETVLALVVIRNNDDGIMRSCHSLAWIVADNARGH